MIRKICVVVTARASYSRVRTLLQAIAQHPCLELQLVIAASALLEKYGSLSQSIRKDAFAITAKVSNALDSENATAAAKTTGLGTIELASVFENIRPDIVVTIADRFETMSTAIAAAFMNIPLAHIQGGEMTGNIDDKVRHAVTQLADIHFAATRMATARIIKMGQQPETVYHTGCPSIDQVFEVFVDPRIDFDPFHLYGGVGRTFDLSKPYLMVMQHPVTTEPENARQQIKQTFDAIHALNIPTLWFWPNADPGTSEIAGGIRTFREHHENLPIHFFKNTEPIHFLKLLKNTACLIGNSSAGIREGGCLGTPVVNIGSRQLGRERGSNVMDATPEKDSILNAVHQQLAKGNYAQNHMYGDGNAGRKIAALLATVPLTFHKQLSY
ncbi:UDP-N-acetylglucosamine 2-epimerase [Dyadobacter pollutisoli]|uniref:UDP-N-acetylglucosamine 2-epimerase n=1 Tax=Dyadobacter pollutisoli TaxID=2910158 RepID=A0A9E8SJS5_9BACT|nr:UDP-N-acetylglucosamine 2-epimerase [Dyadobacter pollutisoli]WAC10514.1 UDP-N-acetylglucosamine 2-epimerase [Dyadobacter pollutisoli]